MAIQNVFDNNVSSPLINTLTNVRIDIYNSSIDDVLEVSLYFAGAIAAIKIIANIIPVLMNPDKEWDSLKIFNPVFMVVLLLLYSPFINTTRTVMASFENLVINAETYFNNGETCIKALQREVFNPLQQTFLDEAYDDKISLDQAWGLKMRLKKANGQEYSDLESIGDLGITLKEYYFDGKDTNGEIYEDLNEEYIQKQKDLKAEELKPSWLTRQFKSFLVWASAIIKSIVLNIRNALLSIVEIGGPIAICMSFIPSLEGSFRKWFGIYIHLYLWAPICTIIDAVSLATFRAFAANFPDVPILSFIVSVVFLITYILVPKITSYFIESKDQGLAMSAGINKAANMVMSSFKNGKNLSESAISSLAGGGAGGNGGGESTSMGED